MAVVAASSFSIPVPLEVRVDRRTMAEEKLQCPYKMGYCLREEHGDRNRETGRKVERALPKKLRIRASEKSWREYATTPDGK